MQTPDAKTPDVKTPDLKTMVRARYGSIAAGTVSGDGPSASCCGPANPTEARDKAQRMGYTDAELAAIPDGANLGLGCGNPQAIAELRPGVTVIDLGSGAGFDRGAFLAEALKRGAEACGGAGRSLEVDLETTRDEVVDVTSEGVDLGELVPDRGDRSGR